MYCGKAAVQSKNIVIQLDCSTLIVRLRSQTVNCSSPFIVVFYYVYKKLKGTEKFCLISLYALNSALICFAV